MSDRLFYVLLPRFNMFSLTNLMEPARIANYLSVEDVYHKKYLSFDGPDITAMGHVPCAIAMYAKAKRKRSEISLEISQASTSTVRFAWLF